MVAHLRARTLGLLTPAVGPQLADSPLRCLLVPFAPFHFAGIMGLVTTLLAGGRAVLLDRFDVVKMSYPETAVREKEILLKHGLKMDNVTVPDKVTDSIVTLVRATREEPWVKEMDQAASVRGTLSLYEKVQAVALLEKRAEATVDDIRNMASSSLGSRMKPSPESKYYDSQLNLIEELMDSVLEGRRR